MEEDSMHRTKRPTGIPPTHPHSRALSRPRSHSEIPFAFLAPPRNPADSDNDDLFSAYINLDGLHSDASGSRTNTNDNSENEADSAIAGLPPRHSRSLSIDSFVTKLNVAADSTFEFGNGEFNAGELKKIATNEKLAEIAMSDPRRVKRILANRQSAARSKERKMRYISELEHKVQTLQTEATTLSAQLTLFQRDYSGLNSQNNELKFRLQAMEQQAKLRDALNDALTGEVQRLKIAAEELGETDLSNNLNQQIQLNPQTFQLQHLQKQQYQFQQQQQNNNVSENETNN